MSTFYLHLWDWSIKLLEFGTNFTVEIFCFSVKMEDFVDSDYFEEDLNSSSSSCSSNSNLSARPKGLSSEVALAKLVTDIRKSLDSQPRSSWCHILKRSLDPSNETSLFPISAIIIGVLQCGFLAIKFTIEYMQDEAKFLRSVYTVSFNLPYFKFRSGWTQNL